MTDLRVSQADALVSTDAAPDLRVTAAELAVSANAAPSLRVSQADALVAVDTGPSLRVSQTVLVVSLPYEARTAGVPTLAQPVFTRPRRPHDPQGGVVQTAADAHLPGAVSHPVARTRRAALERSGGVAPEVEDLPPGLGYIDQPFPIPPRTDPVPKPFGRLIWAGDAVILAPAITTELFVTQTGAVVATDPSPTLRVTSAGAVVATDPSPTLRVTSAGAVVSTVPSAALRVTQTALVVSIPYTLAGSTDGVSALTGALTVAKALAGTITGQSTLASVGGIPQALAGTISGHSALSGALERSEVRVTQLSAEVLEAGAGALRITADNLEALLADPRLQLTAVNIEVLFPVVPLDGTIAGLSALTSELRRLKWVSGQILGVSQLSSPLHVDPGLLGTIAGQSDMGAPRLQITPPGRMASESALSGVLSVERPVRCTEVVVSVSTQEVVEASVAGAVEQDVDVHARAHLIVEACSE